MSRSLYRISIILSMFVILSCGCRHDNGEMTVSHLDMMMDFETRLTDANFVLVDSDNAAVSESWEKLESGARIPEKWGADFSGTEIAVPSCDPETAFGITHEDGRITVVYPVGQPGYPEYGNIIPLAVAHYLIPNKNLEILLLVVCFQSDPKGSMSGIGARTVNINGEDLSAPFAIAMSREELQGKFFYDDFINGGKVQAVCERSVSDQSFLLLTRLNEGTILSTYVPWY
ncbi:MAG: hypothetical protein NTY09_07060 [bacterium]|nr:hypothetical protein [bacterium]